LRAIITGRLFFWFAGGRVMRGLFRKAANQKR
jgi:hypothetical protein